MQSSIADLLAGPWALLPDRLPFVRAALSQKATPQAKIKAVSRSGAVNGRPAGTGGIAVLPFYGAAVQRTDAHGEALGLLNLARFTQALRAALADGAVGGIVLDVDSPGGSVYGVGELADEIYRARARKPIFAIANSLAAAGAYWIASAASEFYVTPGGEVGGIGVHDMHVDLSKGLEKAGIETTLIAAGKYKTEGNPFHPLGADARAAMQKRVDAYYRAFVAAVAKHRNVPESTVRNGMGQGRLLCADRAKRENMVDDVAALDDVMLRLSQHIGQRTPSPGVARVRTSQRFVGALKNQLKSKTPHTATSAAARQREIESLAL
ncbi:S49 family peptidase [Burkholderia pseudomallei]|uniref:S49 family peptidase n=1 Tax=Burkholderia pseudomallei TaxID=28450 RepID=UPI000E724581|nr:S49 family peptidase [Burkholderia pseudomallei]AYE29330.1 peptidase S49 [Burkholderia pseudomallei]MBF3779001.1 S49 family peptidase [Burkholderia pseudomallei]MBF4060261.1 S49 family peptidase [Burkholderia pseudomallei]MBF4078359.1 S49 family peptidase [Burkholderia pseudomallei]